MSVSSTSSSSPISYWSLFQMLSIFAFILHLNSVLALALLRPESSVSVPDINTNGDLMARQEVIGESFSIPMSCNPFSCVVEVDIGSPPTTYNLLVDTGSGITWVGANKPYVSTTSTFPTGQNISIDYGVGKFFGTENLDTVTLGKNFVINQQSIGVADPSLLNKLNPIVGSLDGILALGPNNLTRGLFIPDINGSTFTVVDELQRQGTLTARAINLITQPTGQSGSAPGVITFGSTQSDNLTSEMELFPITRSKIGGADQFWAVDMGITYGTTNLLSNGPVLMSSGTTGIQLAIDVFEGYQKATGSVPDENGRLVVTPDQAAGLQPLRFTVLQNIYTLSPSAQIQPRAPGDDPNKVLLVPTAATAPSNESFGAILGSGFTAYYSTAYDSDNGLVGIASTPFTNATVN